MYNTVPANPAPNVWDIEAKDFIVSINSDFYVTLLEFQGYWNTPFHTKDLSVYQLLSIAECYILSKINADVIISPINVHAIMDIVRARLNKSEKYGSLAERYMGDLLCGTYGTAGITKDTVIGELAEGEKYVSDSPDSELTINSNARTSKFL